MKLFCPIVEGHGEVGAVPALIYRIADHFKSTEQILVNNPLRVRADKFLHDSNEFRRFVALAGAKAAEAAGTVLILLDCEDYCPAALGPQLLQRAAAIRNDVPFLVVLAHREFESWFLTAAESLRGVGGLPDDLDAPPDPEAIRGAKEWLGRRLPNGYDPIRHQLMLTRQFDIAAARSSYSFNRLVDRIGAVLVG